MTYAICGAVFEGRDGVERRCYGRGWARYEGRCKGHAAVAMEGVRGARCGYQGETWSGLPCSALVGRVGGRCARHREDALREQRAAQRRELRETLEKLGKQRAKLDARMARVREKLGELGGQLEAAE